MPKEREKKAKETESKVVIDLISESDTSTKSKKSPEMITRRMPHWACTATIGQKKKEESASKPKELDLDAETDDDGTKKD